MFPIWPLSDLRLWSWGQEAEWSVCEAAAPAEGSSGSSSGGSAAPLGGRLHRNHRLFLQLHWDRFMPELFIYEHQSAPPDPSRTAWRRQWSVKTTWEAPCARDDRWFGPNNLSFCVAREGNLKPGLFLEFHLPSSLPVGFDSKAKTKMAADSVQVGKVDNCCEKCANLLQSLNLNLGNSIIVSKSSLCESVVLYLCIGPELTSDPKELSGNYRWIEAWETIIQSYLSWNIQVLNR